MFKEKVGGLGKFPVLIDGDITVTESGNIAEYVDPPPSAPGSGKFSFRLTFVWVSLRYI